MSLFVLRHVKNIYSVWGKNVEVVNVKTGGSVHKVISGLYKKCQWNKSYRTSNSGPDREKSHFWQMCVVLLPAVLRCPAVKYSSLLKVLFFNSLLI